MTLIHKRRQTALQKVCFWTIKRGLLQGKRHAFGETYSQIP